MCVSVCVCVYVTQPRICTKWCSGLFQSFFSNYRLSVLPCSFVILSGTWVCLRILCAFLVCGLCILRCLLKAVSLSIDPPRLDIEPGTAAVFTCLLDPPDEDLAEIVWARTDGRPLPGLRSSLMMQSFILTISNVQPSDSGVYTCSGSVRGQPILASSRLTGDCMYS